MATHVQGELAYWDASTGKWRRLGDSDLILLGGIDATGGARAIKLIDNTADAFQILEAANEIIGIDTSNGSELITLGYHLHIGAEVTGYEAYPFTMSDALGGIILYRENATNSFFMLSNTAGKTTIRQNAGEGITVEASTAFAEGVGGSISFSGIYTGTSQTIGAKVRAYKESAVDGEYGFALSFETREDGEARSEKMRLTGAGVLDLLTHAISGVTTLGMSDQLTSTLAIGTAPFAVTSTDLNINLNADLLDSQEGSYYLNSDNFTGTKWTDLTDSGETSLHIHDGRYYTESEVDALTWDANDIVSGTLTHERGGLEADVNAYDGLLKISGGATSAITDNSIDWDSAVSSIAGYGDIVTHDADEFETVRVKELFIPCAFTLWDSVRSVGGTNGFAQAALGNGSYTSFNIAVPNDFTDLVSAVVVMIPDTTETVQWDVYTMGGAAGELADDFFGSALNETQAVTKEKLTECDVSGVLSIMHANHYIGMKFVSNTNNLYIIGLRIKYE